MLEKEIEKLQQPPFDADAGLIDGLRYKIFTKTLRRLIEVKRRSNKSNRSLPKNHQPEEIHHLNAPESGVLEANPWGDLPMRRNKPRKR